MQTFNKQNIIKLKGNPYITYDGLVELSKQKFIKSFTSQIIQLPTESNKYEAIMEATLVALELFNDQLIEVTFTGIGDASPANCSHMVSNHVLRMADTRARGRALRDFLGVGVALREEDGNNADAFSATQQSKNSTITLDQRQLISKLFDEKEIPKEKRKQFSKDITGIADFKSYDYVTANQLIEALQRHTSA